MKKGTKKEIRKKKKKKQKGRAWSCNEIRVARILCAGFADSRFMIGALAETLFHTLHLSYLVMSLCMIQYNKYNHLIHILHYKVAANRYNRYYHQSSFFLFDKGRLLWRLEIRGIFTKVMDRIKNKT